MITEPEDRIKLLLEIGFKKEILPKRPDDFIIDARALEDSFVCETNKKVFPLFSQLAVIHEDAQIYPAFQTPLVCHYTIIYILRIAIVLPLKVK